MTREEALANPEAANAALNSFLAGVVTDAPVAELPPDDRVDLPGGLSYKGQLIKHVMVRELTGEDEEALARAIQNPNPFHFLNTLIGCGVVCVGDLSPEDTKKVLPELLVGDRDEIVLGIRRATYGDTVDVYNWVCPNCGGKVDEISFSLTEDVERIKLADPANDTTFDVPLRKGAKARVRLATGAIQTATWEMPDLLQPQRDDVLLTKCVETLTAPNGQQNVIAAFPSLVRKMSAPDRRAILKELTQRQPGPRYNEIKFKHDGCGDEVALALGIRDLFRELVFGLV